MAFGMNTNRYQHNNWHFAMQNYCKKRHVSKQASGTAISTIIDTDTGTTFNTELDLGQHTATFTTVGTITERAISVAINTTFHLIETNKFRMIAFLLVLDLSI